jgi:hypothetical protein
LISQAVSRKTLAIALAATVVVSLAALKFQSNDLAALTFNPHTQSNANASPISANTLNPSLLANKGRLKVIPADKESTSAVMAAVSASKIAGQSHGHASTRIALISPVFTAAAYDHSFYVFYRHFGRISSHDNVTTQLNLLTARITYADRASASSTMRTLAAKLKQSANAQVTILDDSSVDRNALFSRNGTNAFDIVVLGHQEYVTQHEYDNLKRFVSDGGTLVLIDGNFFYAEVKYNSQAQSVTLVKGHGWAYNGHSAWKSIEERWANETREWAGSNYLCYSCKIRFENNPFGYRHHEEQYITNLNDVILYKYRTTDKGHTIATYQLSYGKGKVIGLSIYSDDVIRNAAFDKYFLFLVVHYGETAGK